MNKFLLQIVFAIRFFLYAIATVLLGSETCVCCGKLCRVLPLCKHCREKFMQYEKSETRCKICGKVLISETGICMKCRPAQFAEQAENVTIVTALHSCFPIFSYSLWRQELVYLWKGRNGRLFTPWFAKISTRVLLEEFNITNGPGGCTAVLVPVPPRPGKILEKGWDQIADLCTWLEYYYGMPVIRCLKRRSGVQQKKLDLENRRQNAKNSYYLSERFSGKAVPNKCIILDDVRTSGATLEACAEVLKAAGATDVKALVLFSVD